MNAAKLDFGLKLERIEAPALWGARAIYSERIHPPVRRRGRKPLVSRLELLFDRQSWVGEKPDLERLMLALNGDPLSAFIEAVQTGVESFAQEDTVHVVRLKGIVFHCSTKRSHGYLYVTAHLEDT